MSQKLLQDSIHLELPNLNNLTFCDLNESNSLGDIVFDLNSVANKS